MHSPDVTFHSPNVELYDSHVAIIESFVIYPMAQLTPTVDPKTLVYETGNNELEIDAFGREIQ